MILPQVLNHGVPVIQTGSKPNGVATFALNKLMKRINDVDYMGTCGFTLEWKLPGCSDWTNVFDLPIHFFQGVTSERYLREYPFTIPTDGPYEFRVTKVDPVENDPVNICEVVWESFNA